ncbi:MAG: helix-turn-helix transcriptional regulator [Candidatus Fimivivens sp.]
MNIEKLLIKNRKSKCMTQSDVAEAIGISRAHYTNIEKGNRRPSPEIAQKIGDILGVDWTTFYHKVS